MAPRTKPCADPAPTPKPGLPPAYHHLSSLLHTLRSIECHHDQICTLLASMERSKKLTAGDRRELATLLDELPIHSLTSELEALAHTLDPA